MQSLGSRRGLMGLMAAAMLGSVGSIIERADRFRCTAESFEDERRKRTVDRGAKAHGGRDFYISFPLVRQSSKSATRDERARLTAMGMEINARTMHVDPLREDIEKLSNWQRREWQRRSLGKASKPADYLKLVHWKAARRSAAGQGLAA